MKAKLIFFATAVIVVAAALLVSLSGPPRTLETEFLGTQATLLVAETPAAHAKGLSGISKSELEADGMVFVYDKAKERQFWMKGMNFNLDFVWMNNNKVLKIDRNVPAPAPGEDPVRVNSDPFEVDMVIEFPAGGVDRYGIVSGQVIHFDL